MDRQYGKKRKSHRDENFHSRRETLMLANDPQPNQNNKNDSFNRKISSTITTTTKTLNHRQHYICPKCEIQIDKKQVTFEKFEQHVIKCDSSKLVCIFCLEVFDLKQEADFNNHIQRTFYPGDNKK